LGHIISTDGIVVYPEKIESTRGWPMPGNMTKVRSYMGIFCYYRRFIRKNLKIASPITSLQKKGVKFKWTPKCEEFFQQLKYIFASAPILNIAYPDKVFVVYIDAYESSVKMIMWYAMSP
jgi:hypothetical protein